MSREQENANKLVVTAYVAAMNDGAFDRVLELFSEDATVQGVTGVMPVTRAVDVWRQLHEGLEMRLTIEAIAAEDDEVAVRYTETGRWIGPFMGHERPTGREYELVAMEWFKLRDGKIVHRWGARDSAAQARQLGFPEK